MPAATLPALEPGASLPRNPLPPTCCVLLTPPPRSTNIYAIPTKDMAKGVSPVKFIVFPRVGITAASEGHAGQPRAARAPPY
jgi:hypothetical protein